MNVEELRMLTYQQARDREQLLLGFSGFEVFCSGCVRLDGPRCCRTLERQKAEAAARPSLWRRLVRRDRP